jgi:nanoRNase/pAp phosphatase (c-di-AMP/oligoRNAs hydrolase)
MKTARARRSDRLLGVLAEYDEVLVVTHDNPDPDAMASGWAILRLVEAKLGSKPRLIGGGDIVRAENRHMVRVLKLPIELVSDMEIPHHAAVVLVDCGALATHHLMARNGAKPLALVDHHGTSRSSDGVPFCDVRPRAAACSSIAASYLREQGLNADAALATALLFAIRTETRGYQTRYSRLDRSAEVWLTKRADLSRIAEIENAPLRREYFDNLVLALQNTFLYGDAALCLLPHADSPEIVGEVADLLIRHEGVKRVLCGAVIRRDLLVSVRTQHGGDDAAELTKTALAGLGHGGGHRHRAGGKVAHITRGRKVPEDLEEVLRARWLAACRLRRRRGTRLVPPRAILQNL